VAVFKRDGSPFYQVEFEFKGRRIRQSAGTANETAAKAFERKLRADLYDEVVLGKAVASSMTIREGVDRYGFAPCPSTTNARFGKRSWGQSSIARELNSAKSLSAKGGLWSGTAVQKVLHNSIYLGVGVGNRHSWSLFYTRRGS
jgi:hypothetical protein